MAQNSKVNPDCSYPANPYHECTETCLREAPPQKNKKGSDHGYPSKVRASSRFEKKKLETETNEHNVSSEAVSTKKHIQDVMDSEDDWYACIGGSPVDILFWLCVFTCLAAMQAILLGMSFPSQQHWLLPVAAFFSLLLLIFNVLFYIARRRCPALTPVPPPPMPPPVVAAFLVLLFLIFNVLFYVARRCYPVLTPPSSRLSPPLSMPAA